MNWSEARRHFYRDAVLNGYPGDYDSLVKVLKAAYPLGKVAKDSQVYAWMERFLKVPNAGTPPQDPRLVNRFKLGADPEFLFEQGGVRIPADQLGLKCGRAFGADTNGRLVEMRPWPSRSAVKVLASIYAEMRWMFALYQQTWQCKWLSGAFLFDDGLGGHVHFGRKRPSRPEEITALDKISNLLEWSGCFPPNGEMRARRKGDKFGQVYGVAGDFRLQLHGYEYRTYPSWLDSPQLTIVVLTLSKLAVFDPTLVPKFHPFQSELNFIKIKNFLAYYKGVDDDAKATYAMISRLGRLPKYHGGDIKSRWGLLSMRMVLQEGSLPKIIPLAIRPSSQEIAEVYLHLMGGTPLGSELCAPTWSPSRPQATNVPMLDYIPTTGKKCKGIGEIFWDMVVPRGYEVGVAGMNVKHDEVDSDKIYVDPDFAKTLPLGWKKKVEDLSGLPASAWKSLRNNGAHFTLGYEWRSSVNTAIVRRAFKCGVFPMYEIGSEPTIPVKWNVKPKPEAPKVNGKVLFEGVRG